jgi:phospholipid-binding lipoprotein MlaA
MKPLHRFPTQVLLRRVVALVFVGLLFAHALGAPVSEPDDLADAAPPPVSDPFIRINRSMFDVNDWFYRKAVRPVSRGYEKTVPRPLRRGLENFFNNLRFPVRFVGSVLQAKFGRATRETGRFLANTTIGIAGFVRVSDRIPVLAPEPTEDIGQAFGSWGIVPGPFLILPVLGPSDVRDLLGRVGDAFLTPTAWRFDYYRDWEVRLAVQSVDVVQSTPELLRNYDAFRANALDPYLAVRDAYLANRAEEIRR